MADFSSFETKEFDVVVSNPPYVNKNEIYNMQFDVTKHEPYEAIFADEEGLIWYKKIIQNLNKNHKCGQKVLFEIGLGQVEPVSNLSLIHI